MGQDAVDLVHHIPVAVFLVLEYNLITDPHLAQAVEMAAVSVHTVAKKD